MNRRWIHLTLLILAATAVPVRAVTPSPLEKEYTTTIERLLPGMGAPEIPARKDAQLELEKLAHEAAAPGKEANRKTLANAVLAKCGPDTARPARIWMLRKLETLGKDEVVAGLATILAESDVEIRDLAKRALANNPSPKAAAALRGELARTTDPQWQVALINALGWRQDEESVKDLVKLARHADASVAEAAVTALADIGGSAAARALNELRQAGAEPRRAVVEASLRVADGLRAAGRHGDAAKIFAEILADAGHDEQIRITALTGVARSEGAAAAPRLIDLVKGDDVRMQLLAARLLSEMDASATTKLVSAVESSGPGSRAILLEILGERGDAAALPVVVKQVTDKDDAVRLAALQAAGQLGNARVLPLLIERGVKTSGAEREAARQSLAALRDKDVDGAIVSALGKATGAERAELLYAVWGRRIAAGKSIAIQSARDADPAVRVAALTALERLGKTEDLGTLIDLVISAEGDASRKAAEEAAASTIRRSGDSEAASQALASAMSKAPPEGQLALIRLLLGAQGEAGLPAIRAAAKSDDPRVKAAAAGALRLWKPTRITTWMVSGPYRQDGKGPTELFDAAFPAEEADGKAQWKPLNVRKNELGGPIDLQKVGKGDNQCAYLRTIIVSESAQDVVLTFGSDDGIKVWLNGVVVHGKNVTRAMNCGEDQVKASLKAGENTLMLKVTQGGSDWSFCAGIQASEGGPPDGVRFQAK